MTGLTALAWRSLAARRLRSALTIAGIALGVGVLFASIATNAGIETAIDRTVSNIVGRADLRVEAFQERGLSDATVEAIRATPGVAVAAPVVERRTYLEAPLGAELPAPVTVLGIDPVSDPQIHDLDVVEGAVPDPASEPAALISERLAHDDGYGLGSEITIQGAGAPETFRIAAILAGDGPLVGAAGRTVVVPIDAATRVFALDGVGRVDIRASAGVEIASLEAALTSRLANEPYVLSSPRDIAASLRASTADFQSTTALIAAVSLFVAAFLIFSTLSMTLGERVREVGLLRAAGATRGQVTSFVFTGAAILGVAGSVLGLVVGAALAAGMAAWMRTIGQVPVERVEIPLPGAAVALLVGLVVTVAAAMEPAWRASRISPIDALRPRVETEPGVAGSARLRWLVAIFGAVALLGLLIWPRGAGGGVVRSLAVYAVLLAATLASPFLLRPLARIAGAPFARFLRFEERLARGSLVRDRSRTALTVGALTIGLAMIVAVGGVAQNARRAASSWLSDVVPGDEVLTSIRPVALDEDVAETLAKDPGVARVTPIASFELAYRGTRLDAAAAVGRHLLVDGRLDVVDGDRTAALTSLDGRGSVVVPRSQANRLGLAVGDTMTFSTGGGATTTLTVRAIVARSLPGSAGESVLVGWDDAINRFGVAGADFFAVRFLRDAPASARAELDADARTLALEPATLDRIQGAVSDALARVFGLFDALAVIAVIVAALGIVNTLTMGVVERVREIGILRATGMTKRQAGRMVVVEAGVLGLVGATLGALTGLAAGLVMIALAGGAGGLRIEPPWSALVLCFGLGVVVSMLAAYYPARLAGRLPIVRAVQFE